MTTATITLPADVMHEVWLAMAARCNEVREEIRTADTEVIRIIAGRQLNRCRDALALIEEAIAQLPA